MGDFEFSEIDAYEPKRILDVNISEKMVYFTVSWKVKGGYRAESVSLTKDKAVTLAQIILKETQEN